MIAQRLIAPESIYKKTSVVSEETGSQPGLQAAIRISTYKYIFFISFAKQGAKSNADFTYTCRMEHDTTRPWQFVRTWCSAHLKEYDGNFVRVSVNVGNKSGYCWKYKKREERKSNRIDMFAYKIIIQFRKYRIKSFESYKVYIRDNKYQCIIEISS